MNRFHLVMNFFQRGDLLLKLRMSYIAAGDDAGSYLLIRKIALVGRVIMPASATPYAVVRAHHLRDFNAILHGMLLKPSYTFQDFSWPKTRFTMSEYDPIQSDR